MVPEPEQRTRTATTYSEEPIPTPTPTYPGSRTKAKTRTKTDTLPFVPPPPPFDNRPYGVYECRQFKGWFDPEATDRFEFGTFFFAFLTIFNLLTLDNWSPIMYRYMTAVHPTACIFFFVVVGIGGYVLTSLFVAILLVNFGKEEKLGRDEEDEFLPSSDEESESTFDEPVATADQVLGVDPEGKAQDKVNKILEKDEAEEKAQHIKGIAAKGHDEHAPPSSIGASNAEVAEGTVVDGEAKESATERFQRSALFSILASIGNAIMNLSDHDDMPIPEEEIEGNALFVFSTKNRLRKVCVRFVGGEYFRLEKTVFLVSLLHVAISPVNAYSLDSDPALAAFRAVDYTLTALSLIEVLMRIIARGGFLGIHSNWKASGTPMKIDFIAVMASVFSVGIEIMIPTTFTSKAAFALRSSRVARLIVRSKAMSNVLLAVFKTVPAMLNILGLSFAIYMIMSIMLVELWNGRMRTCNDASDRSVEECVGYWRGFADDGVQMQPYTNGTSRLILREWKNYHQFHFDNVFNAFSTLMEVSMVSQWSDPMFAMMDSRVSGGRPSRYTFTDAAWLFIFWVFVSNFILLNIFAGTVVDNFARLKLEMAGSLFLTEEQTEIAHIRKLLHQSRAKKVLSVPEVPFVSHALNVLCFSLANNVIFLNFMRFMVLFNCVIITTFHYKQGREFFDLQFWANVAVSFAFTLEMLVKIGISGFKAYISIGIHRLDSFIVAESLVEIVLFITWDAYEESQTLQLFRLLRVLRLVREQKGFRKLIHSGYRAIPAMANVGALLVLIFYVFAMIGMALFDTVRFEPDSRDFLSNNMNFKSFPKAMFTLYRVATLDDWGIVSRACGLSEPYCSKELDNCGNKTTSRIFYNTFIIMCAFVMLNLFIAVVLENFSESVLLPTYMHERMQDVNVFRSVWASFDPQGRQVVSASAFVKILLALPGPRKRLDQLKASADRNDGGDSICSWTPEEMEYYAAHSCVGLSGEAQASIIPTLRQLDLYITMPNQEVLFADAIDAIGEKIFHVKLVDRKVQHVHEKLKVQAAEYGHQWHIVEHYAACLVQAGYRKYRAIQADPEARAKAARFSKWDEILAPILQEVWAHHAEGVFDKDETEEERARFRRMVKGHRRKDKERDAQMNAEDENERVDGEAGKNEDGDEEGEGGQKRHIKQKLRIADALAAKMNATEVVPDEPEDLSWMEAVADVESEGSSDAPSDGEEFWLSNEARALNKTNKEKVADDEEARVLRIFRKVEDERKREQAAKESEERAKAQQGQFTAAMQKMRRASMAANQGKKIKIEERETTEGDRLADFRRVYALAKRSLREKSRPVAQGPAGSAHRSSVVQTAAVERVSRLLAADLKSSGLDPSGDRHVHFVLPLQFDREDGTLAQMPSLSTIIQRRKKQLAVELGPEMGRSVRKQAKFSHMSESGTSSAAERTGRKSPEAPVGGIAAAVARLPHNASGALSMHRPYQRRWQPMPQPPDSETIPFEEWRPQVDSNRLLFRRQMPGTPGATITAGDVDLTSDVGSAATGTTQKSTKGRFRALATAMGKMSSAAKLRPRGMSMMEPGLSPSLTQTEAPSEISMRANSITGVPGASAAGSTVSSERSAALKTKLKVLAMLTGLGSHSHSGSAPSAGSTSAGSEGESPATASQTPPTGTAATPGPSGSPTKEEPEELTHLESMPKLQDIVRERRILRTKRLEAVTLYDELDDGAEVDHGTTAVGGDDRGVGHSSLHQQRDEPFTLPPSAPLSALDHRAEGATHALPNFRAATATNRMMATPVPMMDFDDAVSDLSYARSRMGGLGAGPASVLSGGSSKAAKRSITSGSGAHTPGTGTEGKTSTGSAGAGTPSTPLATPPRRTRRARVAPGAVAPDPKTLL